MHSFARSRLRLSLLVVLAGLLASACATSSGARTAGGDAQGTCADRVVGAPGGFQAEEPLPLESVQLEPLAFEETEDAFAFVDGKTGASLTFEEVLARARQADAVLVGEQHDQASHHRLQRRVVEGLAQSPGLTVGLEMVPWSLQPALDRFNQGEIDADGLKQALDWEKTWGHDFELYRPIFEQGREKGVRFWALNAPRPLVKSIAKKGVSGLDAEECAQIPELDLSDAAHRAEIQEVFHHHGPTSSGDAFERFYSAQVLWDESMADRAVAALQDGAERVVVLAGVGHVAGGRGIAKRIQRRRPDARVLTIVPLNVGDGEDPDAVARRGIAEREGDILAIKRPAEALSL